MGHTAVPEYTAAAAREKPKVLTAAETEGAHTLAKRVRGVVGDKTAMIEDTTIEHLDHHRGSMAARSREPHPISEDLFRWLCPFARLLMSVQIGPISLKHLIVMEPLTGSRSEQPGEIPGALMLEYYAQRASDGGWRRLRDRCRTQKGDHLLAKRAAAAVKPVLVMHPDTT